VPPGLTVLGVDELLAAGLTALQSPDRNVRSLAVQDLSHLIPFRDQVVPALVERFQQDKDDHVRRVAAACLASVCVRDKAALPLVKQALKDPDDYIRMAFQTALDGLANAKDTPAQEEQLRRERAIAQQINAFLRAAGGRQ